MPHILKNDRFAAIYGETFFPVVLGRKNLLCHKIGNHDEIFTTFKISFHYGFEMGNLKYYGILTHMYCFIVYHVKISHFFRAKNGPLEEHPMSPENEPSLMWLANQKLKRNIFHVVFYVKSIS